MPDQRRALTLSFDPVPAPSGAARRVEAALRAWGPRLQLDALSSKVIGEPHIERFAGARLMRVPAAGDFPSRVQAFERAARRQLASEEYDLVFCGDAVAAEPVLSRRAETPFKLIADGSQLWAQLWPLVAPELAGEPRIQHRLLRYERQLIAQADLVLSGSEAQDEVLVELGVPYVRLRRIWPSVDLQRFPDLPLSDFPGLRIATVASGAPWEGLETALGAIALGRAQGLDLRLGVAGPLSPAVRQSLREIADGLGISAALELHGEIAEERVGEFLGSAHVTLATLWLPARALTTALGSYRLAEALCVNRPVITSESPVLREIAGDAALYVAHDDVEALARTLFSLANDPALAAALGQRGRLTALSRFEAARAKQGWVGLAAELLDPDLGAFESSPSSRLPLPESPTLTVEPTHHGLVADPLSDTRPTPGETGEANENATVVTGDRPRRPDWHRPHTPGDETPTPLKSF